MYIKRFQLARITELLSPQKAVLLYGPRRCGKTTLITEFSRTLTEPFLLVTGDDITVRDYLSSQSLPRLREFVGTMRLLIIDEAQRIPSIGLNLKLLLDNVPGLRILATGSSAFDLARQTGAPLTGRHFTLRLFPFARLELEPLPEFRHTAIPLDEYLIYGSYPEVILNRDQRWRQQYLRELVGSYLYKDVLELDGVRHADKLVRLLQCLALQLGHEVSCSELGTNLGMSKNTVDRYLNLLAKSFVVFRLPGFSRSPRQGVVKNARYYFYDTGVRNALLNNFNPLATRDDVGALWENYLIVERHKKQDASALAVNNYFWRTYDQSEIDFVEERDGKLYGYEIKWRARDADRAKKKWQAAYPGAEFRLLSSDDYLNFIV